LSLSNSQYVDCGDFKSWVNDQKGITVMCWFKSSNLDTWQHLVNQGGGWDEKGWSLFMIGPILRIELQNSKKVICDNQLIGKISNNKWYHACFTYDGSKIRCYFNGKKLKKTKLILMAL